MVTVSVAVGAASPPSRALGGFRCLLGQLSLFPCLLVARNGTVGIGPGRLSRRLRRLRSRRAPQKRAALALLVDAGALDGLLDLLSEGRLHEPRVPGCLPPPLLAHLIAAGTALAPSTLAAPIVAPTAGGAALSHISLFSLCHEGLLRCQLFVALSYSSHRFRATAQSHPCPNRAGRYEYGKPHGSAGRYLSPHCRGRPFHHTAAGK